jgi:hypothetical protein
MATLAPPPALGRLDPVRLAPPRFTCTAARLGLALLFLGILCRLFRYALRFPIWGDEAYIIVNLLDRDFLGLTHELDCNQVAPVLFLWAQKAVCLTLGSSEWALRLLPLLAGLAGLVLFWHLARLTLGSLAATCAVGLFSLGRWPVTLCSVVKPYSFDLLAALLLLLPAVYLLRRPEQNDLRGDLAGEPERVRWLILLTFLVPFALLASYPAVFVAGGLSLALLVPVWRSRSWKFRGWFIAYNAAMVLAFLGWYLLEGQKQLDPEMGRVNNFMHVYWAHGFPPAGVKLLYWLLDIHAGRMMAYPVGDANFGSVLTLLLFLAGVWRFRKQPVFLGLCLGPFAVNLLAAVVRKYPYGGCCRLSQHLAPAICLLAGAGLAWLYRRLERLPGGALRAVVVFSALLGLLGLGQLIADAAVPYRDTETVWMARVATTVLQSARPEDQIVVIQPRRAVEPMFRYHLGRHPRVTWAGQIDPRKLEREDGQVWLLDLRLVEDGHEAEAGPAEAQPVLPEGWTVTDRARYVMPPMKKGHPFRTCEVSRWTPRSAEPRPTLPCWP